MFKRFDIDVIKIAKKQYIDVNMIKNTGNIVEIEFLERDAKKTREFIKEVQSINAKYNYSIRFIELSRLYKNRKFIDKGKAKFLVDDEYYKSIIGERETLVMEQLSMF